MFVVATKSRNPFCANQWYKLVGFKVRRLLLSNRGGAIGMPDKFTSYSEETIWLKKKLRRRRHSNRPCIVT